MSSASSVSTPAIAIERSRLLGAVLLTAHVGGAGVLASILPAPAAAAGAVVLIGALVDGWRWHLGPRRVVRVHARAGDWLLEDAAGRQWWARLTAGSTVAVAVTVLGFVDRRGRRRTVVVLPDSASPEARRRLRVAAREAATREADTTGT